MVERRLHELSRLTIQNDIYAFLGSKLKPINPSTEGLKNLTKQSEALFRRAAFFVDYVLGAGESGATERMQLLLGTSLERNKEDRLDAMYSAALEASFDDHVIGDSERAEAILVLHTVLCFQQSLDTYALVGLPGLRLANSAHYALKTLGLVLSVSETSGLITTRYPSFRDYMLDAKRSGKFYCEVREHSARLAKACFNLIEAPNPPYNICNLQSSYLRDRD
ncbi:hypothetical protein FRC07_008609, partial [Ceratobasidium sp. 392]